MTKAKPWKIDYRLRAWRVVVPGAAESTPFLSPDDAGRFSETPVRLSRAKEELEEMRAQLRAQAQLVDRCLKLVDATLSQLGRIR